MKSRIIRNRKQATTLVSPQTLEMAIQKANEAAEVMMDKNPNDPRLDQLEEASSRLQGIRNKSPQEMQAEGFSNLEEYLDNATNPQVAEAVKKDVDFILQMVQETRSGAGAAPIAASTHEAAGNGSDGFVTDRDDKGEAKMPEKVDVPRYAAKKKEAEPEVPAQPAPAAPAKANPIDYIPTEALLKIIEQMPKDEDFAQNKGKQDALIELTNILKSRPVLPPEQPKGEAAPAPAAAPAAAPVASQKKADGEAKPAEAFVKEIPQSQGKQADGQIYRQDNPQPAAAGEFVKNIPQSQDNAPKAASEDKTAVAPPGWEGTVKEMKHHKDIDNPYALAWSMKDKGYTPHASSWMLKRKGAAYMAKKFAAGAGGAGAWTSDAATSKVEEGAKVPEVAQAHGLRDDNTGIKRPETTLPEKLAADMTTNKALKQAEGAQEKLKALYLEVKPLTEANNTRSVREAVELVYAAYSAFDEAIKVFNKQQMQEEEEEKAAQIRDNVENKKKKSSFFGLSVAAAE